jgi:hypothetical protein
MSFPCNGGGCTGPDPPDTNGAVGPNNYIQTVNAEFAIYDKSGNLLAGPTNINQIWIAAGTGDACQLNNNGDPIVVYDQIADRWLLSQFVAYSNECIAISKTANPVSGGWYLYNFPCPSACNNLDYPKFGLWPDGYYMGSNALYGGGHAWAFDRTNMLLGNPATAQRFATPTQFMLPSDLKGSTLPASGAPNIFVRQIDGAEFGGADRLQMDAFHVDWTTPASSTFTALPDLNTAAFDSNICGFGFRNSCIPEPAGGPIVDSIRSVPMYPLMYRNFGTYETLTVAHDECLNGSCSSGITAPARVGVRWYELRNTGSGWSIYQQGDYSPDSTNRWTGSMSMDRLGDIALGYSVSDASSVYPGIRYTGRLPSDTLGTMSQPEQTLIAGNKADDLGSSKRWGDYSAMQIDPVDGCTFWYTTEYYTTVRPGWSTRIGTFRFSECAVSITVSYSIIDGGSPTAPVFSYTSGGNPHTYTLTTTPTPVTVDTGTSWSVAPNPLTGSTGTERWYSIQILSGTATGGALAFIFYHQYLQTLSYAITPVLNHGSPTAPTFSALWFGVSLPLFLTQVATGYWYDAGSSWTLSPNPLSPSTGSEQWITSQSTSGTVSSATTILFTFHHQFFLTVNVLPSAVYGSTAPGSGWNDYNSPVSVMANANAGYSLGTWTTSGVSCSGGPTSNPCTFNMPLNAATLTANFVINTVYVNLHLATYKIVNVQVQVLQGSTVVASTSVTLSYASPNAQLVFTHVPSGTLTVRISGYSFPTQTKAETIPPSPQTVNFIIR